MRATSGRSARKTVVDGEIWTRAQVLGAVILTKDADFVVDKKTFRGFEIVSTGKPPWRVADAEVGLALKNPKLTKATRLDPAGYPAAAVPLKKSKGGVTLELPPETMYLILE